MISHEEIQKYSVLVHVGIQRRQPTVKTSNIHGWMKAKNGGILGLASDIQNPVIFLVYYYRICSCHAGK